MATLDLKVELSTLNITGFAYIVAFCKKVHDNNRPVKVICLHAAGTLMALTSLMFKKP